jgi:small GTP-binding protein
MATSKFKSNKSNDLLIIKELEKEWGIKLKKYTSSRWKRQNGYYYINNKIIGFAFSGGMKYLPKSLSSLKNLEFLFLEGNRLTDISSLKNLKKLKELDLSHNTINDISPLKNLDSLAKLYLYENSIENLTPLSKLRNLEILDAAHNSISDISSLSKLTKLKKLELNHNSIIDISSVENLSKLEVLNLWNNQIRDLSSLHKLTNLENIDLFSNHINDISALKELKKLIKLDLGSNEITEITELKDLRNLKTLHLWKNNIKDISILSHLRNLTELKISYCKLTDISPLKDLKELKMLDLANNNLIYFPAWLLETQMENSSGDTYGIIESGFCLVDNPIENVPAELLQENKSVIGDYFKSLEYGSQAINEIKVILLGEGAAGKTSLMNYLQGKPFNKEEPQTHGINLEECTGLSGVTMKVWDFGGQDIMHHTHQFFLTKKSVYVIVLNARENTDTEKWLKLVQVFGGDSPVIILTNKIDENPSAHENIKYLNTKYNNLNNRYLRISVEKGTGLKEFKSLLTETITELLHVRTLWANSWLGVKKELEEMRSGESLKDYIHFEKYEEI